MFTHTHTHIQTKQALTCGLQYDWSVVQFSCDNFADNSNFFMHIDIVLSWSWYSWLHSSVIQRRTLQWCRQNVQRQKKYFSECGTNKFVEALFCLTVRTLLSEASWKTSTSLSWQIHFGFKMFDKLTSFLAYEWCLHFILVRLTLRGFYITLI